MTFSKELEKCNLKICMEPSKPKKPKQPWAKKNEEKVWYTQLQILSQNVIVKIALEQRETYRPTEQNWDPGKKPGDLDIHSQKTETRPLSLTSYRKLTQNGLKT
jgi:hypothetical protein